MTMKRVTIKLYESQRRELNVEASKSGLGLSAFIRKVLSDGGFITPDAELFEIDETNNSQSEIQEGHGQ